MGSVAIRTAAVIGILMLAIGLPSGLEAFGQDPTDGEIRRLTEAYAQAWAKGDAKAVTGLYTSEAIRISPEGKVAVGRSAIEQALTEALVGPYRGTRIGLTSGQRTRAAQDAYVAEGTFLIVGGMPPPGTATRGRYMHTLVRVSGRWQIAGEGTITAPRPPK
jgi:uncharacterized protein (TIGR02246 family)